MEYEKIKQLMDDMGNSKLTSIDIEFPDGIKIKMEKNNEKQVVVTNIEEQITKEQNNNNAISKEENKEKIEEGNIVKSPMIGTFYMKPSPDSDPYVEIGSTVKKGTVLCIIEAMKLMNEIESDLDGEIVEICCKEEDLIEYGTVLFKIK